MNLPSEDMSHFVHGIDLPLFQLLSSLFAYMLPFYMKRAWLIALLNATCLRFATCRFLEVILTHFQLIFLSYKCYYVV